MFLLWWHNSPAMVAQLSSALGELHHFTIFFYTLPVDRLLQLVQLSHYIKQVNPPKFYLQHLVWGSYLSSLQRVQNVKHGSTLPGLPYLVERLVQGCAAQIGCFFGLSGFAMPLFYLKTGFDIGRVFAKCIISDEFVLYL